MNISKVIAQLRQAAPFFNSNIAGAAEFEEALKNTGNLPMPSAYVVPLEDMAHQNMTQNTLRQLVTERIGVYVEVDGSLDRRGQAGVTGLAAAKRAIFKAILDWNPEPDRAQRGLSYAGGNLVGWDRSRVWWELVFELDAYITQINDGWMPSGVPLTLIEVNMQTGDQTIVVAATWIDASFSIVLPKPIASFSLSVDADLSSVATAPRPSASMLLQVPD